jgi:ATP/maltotriose-dependent transcriptional regulator MalT
MLAKLSRPRLYETLYRDRLCILIFWIKDRPVLNVVAPPGAGKTTLVASYLEQRRTGGIWYQMDVADADPAAFFHYMSLAERQLARKRRALPPLPAFGPESVEDIVTFSRRFFRELFERMRPPSSLVLDNFQEVEDSAPFHDVLVPALEQVPVGIRVVVISRAPLPGAYARLVANRVIGTCDWEAIKLSEAETAGILRMLGTVVGDDVVRTMHRQTGGWTAGVVLLAEHLRFGGTATSAMDPESLQQVFGYFAGELFSRAAPDDRHMLLRLGYMPRFTSEQAVSLTGNPAAANLIEKLYRRRLFTDRRPGMPPVYQFHALFRAFLQHRANESLEARERDEAGMRAAALLENAGDSAAAMNLYLQHGAPDFAQEILLREAETLLGQGRSRAVIDWITALPAHRVQTHPWLLYWLGTAQNAFEPERAQATLARAYERAVEVGDTYCQSQAAAGMIEALLLEYRYFERFDKWIEILSGILGNERAFSGIEAYLRAQSALLIACTYRQPDHPGIDRSAAYVTAALERELDVNLKVVAAMHLNVYGFYTNRMEVSRFAMKVLEPLIQDPALTPRRRIFARATIIWASTHTSDYDLGMKMVEANERELRDSGSIEGEALTNILAFYLDMVRDDRRSARASGKGFAYCTAGTPVRNGFSPQPERLLGLLQWRSGNSAL